MKLYHIEMLLLLWAIPALAGIFILAAYRRRQLLRVFAESGMLEHLTQSISTQRRIAKAVLVLIAVAFLVFSLARPAWNPKPKTITRSGRDVVFLLDVSKSMLAEDLAPNRLERAKLAIRDCIETLDGDRVGLVAFAGTAALKCPLTLDYGFFRMMLEGLTTDSIARGGTHIGDALRKTLTEVFDDQAKKFKDVVLITDGEDHDSFPLEAAEDAGKEGIRLIAIGLGDENQGKRIPVTNAQGRREFMKYKGEEIWTRLDADTLRKMVNATNGGKYLNVATGSFDLGRIYQELIATAEKKELEAKTITLYEEKFQVFLALSFLLLCVEMVISERKRTKA